MPRPKASKAGIEAAAENSQESLRRSHHSPQFTVAKYSQKLNWKPLQISSVQVSGFHNLQGSSVSFQFLPHPPLGVLPLGPLGSSADGGSHPLSVKGRAGREDGQAWSLGFHELDPLGFNVWCSRVSRGPRVQPLSIQTATLSP